MTFTGSPRKKSLDLIKLSSNNKVSVVLVSSCNNTVDQQDMHDA
jgi:hypothetical protein